MKKLLGVAGVFHLLLIATLGVFVQAAPARIINGELAKEGDYPYFAQTFNTNDGECGGSLIDERWVLTAAHCLRVISVIVGSITNGDVGANGIEAFCTEYIPHPNYDGDVINDVALCKLDRDVLIDNSRIMLELNQEENFPDVGSDTRVMGYGSTIEGVDSYPENLLDVNLTIVSNDDCNEAYGSIEPQQICASDTGKDSCQGDSGGPLVQRRDNGDGTFTDTQVGIVSFGTGCADPNFPGVYSRVSFFYDNFIVSTICSGDQATPDSPLCQRNIISPSSAPSSSPVGFPSNAPSDSPLGLPSSAPSDSPVGFPSSTPSDSPLGLPSSAPPDSPVGFPSSAPSDSPVGFPSSTPSDSPVGLPSSAPSDSPVGFPSSAPSDSPVGFPSSTPSDSPVGFPSSAPSVSPVGFPSSVPTGNFLSPFGPVEVFLAVPDGTPQPDVQSAIVIATVNSIQQQPLTRKLKETSKVESAAIDIIPEASHRMLQVSNTVGTVSAALVSVSCDCTLISAVTFPTPSSCDCYDATITGTASNPTSANSTLTNSISNGSFELSINQIIPGSTSQNEPFATIGPSQGPSDAPIRSPTNVPSGAPTTVPILKKEKKNKQDKKNKLKSPKDSKKKKVKEGKKEKTNEFTI